jgi:hypothetical protein
LNGPLLLDNSAWARLALRSLPDARADQIAAALEAGELVVSLPFLLEAGYSAPRAIDHQQLIDDLLALPWASIDEEVERRALDAQRVLAALADRRKLGILHYDADFELILERTDLRFESVWLAERGAL